MQIFFLHQMFIHTLASVPVFPYLSSGVCVFTVIFCLPVLFCYLGIHSVQEPLYSFTFCVFLPLCLLSFFSPSSPHLSIFLFLWHAELSQIIPLLPGGRRLILTTTATVWPGRRLRRRCCCGRTSATTTPLCQPRPPMATEMAPMQWVRGYWKCMNVVYEEGVWGGGCVEVLLENCITHLSSTHYFFIVMKNTQVIVVRPYPLSCCQKQKWLFSLGVQWCKPWQFDWWDRNAVQGQGEGVPGDHWTDWGEAAGPLIHMWCLMRCGGGLRLMCPIIKGP